MFPEQPVSRGEPLSFPFQLPEATRVPWPLAVSSRWCFHIALLALTLLPSSCPYEDRCDYTGTVPITRMISPSQGLPRHHIREMRFAIKPIHSQVISESELSVCI